MKIIDKVERFFQLGWIEDCGTYGDKEKQETTKIRKELESALKLQELVKDMITNWFKENERDDIFPSYGQNAMDELQSLVEKSEK